MSTITPGDIRRAYAEEARNEKLIREWAAKRKARPAARKGRIGIKPVAERVTRSLPSGQPASWRKVAGSVLALSGLFLLLGVLVARQVGRALIEKGRGRR